MSPSITDCLQARRGQWPRVATLVAALITSSCRFGGPSGDPSLPVVADGAAGTAGSGGQAGTAGSGGQGGIGGNGGQGGIGGNGGVAGEAGSTSTDGSAGATADAGHDISGDIAPEGGPDGDAASLDDRADASRASDSDPPDSAPPTSCTPPFSSAVCDPVCNVGCSALLRCDITDTPRTGVCVGTLLSTVTEGMPCTRTAVTDECTERLSCLEGICRRLCYRDTDCTTSGTCCDTAIDVDAGPSGYRICTPCGP
jgi:hypothetical protein